MKKCFVILEFGKPFPWLDTFIDHVGKLGQYGWDWKIFTPNKHKPLANVDIVDMNIAKFSQLVKKKTGVKPKLFITDEGIPNVHVTDYMVAYGKIFEDYLKNVDMWGMMGGPDIVFGRLDRFLLDLHLEEVDIYTDDTKAINGCFTLFKNNERMNNLFKQIPNWQDAFTQDSCPKCTKVTGQHILYGTDEYGMTEVIKNVSGIIGRPKYYPLHGHDRLENHKIELKEDGSLWELNYDINPPAWEHARPVFGREIMYYHFSQTKKWPL